MKYFYSSDRLAGLLGLLRLRNIRRCMSKKGGTFLSHFDPKYSSAVGNLWKNEKPTRQNLYLWSDPRTATATFGNYLDRDTDLPPRGTREIFSTKTYHNHHPGCPVFDTGPECFKSYVHVSTIFLLRNTKLSRSFQGRSNIKNKCIRFAMTARCAVSAVGQFYCT